MTEPDKSPPEMVISGEDFQFLYESFRLLTSPYTSNDRLAEVIKTEDAIWAWLQRIESGQPNASLVRNTTAVRGYWQSARHLLRWSARGRRPWHKGG